MRSCLKYCVVDSKSLSKMMSLQSVDKSYFKAGGSKTAEELNSSLLNSDYEGFVFNLTENVTTDSNWVDGSDYLIPAGTNVVVTKTNSGYKFDALGASNSGGSLDDNHYVQEETLYMS